MTDNEKLIAGLRELIAVAPQHMTVRGVALIGDAIAALEKAHTPTDDERGVIETIKTYGHLAAQVMVFRGDTYPVKAIPYTSFLHILDGFRRSVVPEPSACLNCGQEFSDGEPRARYVDRGEAHSVSCPEPQGEPSEHRDRIALAEFIDKALDGDAGYGVGAFLAGGILSFLCERSALRAASAVTAARHDLPGRVWLTHPDGTPKTNEEIRAEAAAVTEQGENR